MKAVMRTYFEDQGFDESECEIILVNGVLKVSYSSFDDSEDENRIAVVYKGIDKTGKGHFFLESNYFDGMATLHTSDNYIFEGWYTEKHLHQTDEGMWRIICDEELLDKKV